MLHREPEKETGRERRPERERKRSSQRARESARESHIDSLWLSLALSLRICLQSPCLAHKALARLGTSFLSSSTLFWSTNLVADCPVLLVAFFPLFCFSSSEQQTKKRWRTALTDKQCLYIPTTSRPRVLVVTITITCLYIPHMPGLLVVTITITICLGRPYGNFSHMIPFFSLRASLTSLLRLASLV